MQTRLLLFETYDEYNMSINEGLISNLMKYSETLSHYGDILYEVGNDFFSLTDNEFIEKWSKITGKEIKDLKSLERLKKSKLEHLEKDVSVLDEQDSFKIEGAKKIKIIVVGFLILLNIFGISLKNASAQTINNVLTKVEKTSKDNEKNNVNISKLSIVEILKSMYFHSIDEIKKMASSGSETLDTTNQKLLISYNKEGESVFSAEGKSEDIGGIHKEKGDLKVSRHESDSKEISKKFQFIRNYFKINKDSSSIKQLQREFTERFPNSKVTVENNNVTYDHFTLDNDDIANGGETNEDGKIYKKGDRIPKGVRLVNIKAGIYNKAPRQEVSAFYIPVKINKNKIWFEESNNYQSLAGTDGNKIIALKGIQKLRDNHIIGKDQKQSGRSGTKGYFMINDGIVYFKISERDIKEAGIDSVLNSLSNTANELNNFLKTNLLQIDNESIKVIRNEVR